MNHAAALADLVGYSEEACMDALVETVFVLADMTTLHTTWMEQLRTINRDQTCLLDQTQEPNDEKLPWLGRAQAKSRRVSCFQSGPCPSCEQAADAIHLVRAAHTVRRYMVNRQTAFSGSFETNCKYQTSWASQLLMFNFSACRRESVTVPIKHNHH